jgi:membrane peptidoglycan carboxypeptidase
MREALALLRVQAPWLEVDGEMHGDAALDTTYRNELMPDSTLRGEANLLVLPNIDAANISYNLLKMAAGGGIAIVFVLMAVVWSGRYGYTIYQLNRGVGDTVFYDAAGRPWFRLDDQRQDVPFEQIATEFKDAVIAVEDHRFYYHPGIDPIGLTRALVYNVTSDEGTQGGSTITQQLARTLFLSNTRTFGRKAKEAALAVMLEAFLSKREILQLYMNRVFLSGGIYGVETMSQKLLRKPASKLTLAEAALIAGIIRRPTSCRRRTAARLLDMRSPARRLIEPAAECSSSGVHAPWSVSIGSFR